MEQQDRTIDTIAGTLTNLAQQAGLMGQEINEHNEYVFVLVQILLSSYYVLADC